MSSASDTPRVYIGAYGFCRDPSGRLLLVRMASGLDQGRWTMPGGGIEWGEHPEAALLRELEEETGIAEVEAIGITEVYSHTYPRSVERPYDSVHHVGIIYNVTVGFLDLRFEQDGSTDRCEWCTEHQARSLPLTAVGAFAVDLAWPAS